VAYPASWYQCACPAQRSKFTAPLVQKQFVHSASAPFINAGSTSPAGGGRAVALGRKPGPWWGSWAEASAPGGAAGQHAPSTQAWAQGKEWTRGLRPEVAASGMLECLSAMSLNFARITVGVQLLLSMVVFEGCVPCSVATSAACSTLHGILTCSGIYTQLQSHGMS
jgi:hypothetical protein